MKCILIQANGNNIRLGKFFNQPKYELYFNGDRIINHIIKNSLETNNKVFIAIKNKVKPKFNNNNVEFIYCNETTNRLDTLKQCFGRLKSYSSVVIHDCDTIIESNILKQLDLNSLAITTYKLDGLKYGFVELDNNLQYIKGNEKEMITDHITIGAYSVKTDEFINYMETSTQESLLNYYNQCDVPPKVIYSKSHLNLGDINSYINNLWSL
jgi:hypothetical protein